MAMHPGDLPAFVPMARSIHRNDSKAHFWPKTEIKHKPFGRNAHAASSKGAKSKPGMAIEKKITIPASRKKKDAPPHKPNPVKTTKSRTPEGSGKGDTGAKIENKASTHVKAKGKSSSAVAHKLRKKVDLIFFTYKSAHN